MLLVASPDSPYTSRSGTLLLCLPSVLRSSTTPHPRRTCVTQYETSKASSSCTHATRLFHKDNKNKEKPTIKKSRWIKRKKKKEDTEIPRSNQLQQLAAQVACLVDRRVLLTSRSGALLPCLSFPPYFRPPVAPPFP